MSKLRNSRPDTLQRSSPSCRLPGCCSAAVMPWLPPACLVGVRVMQELVSIDWIKDSENPNIQTGRSKNCQFNSVDEVLAETALEAKENHYWHLCGSTGCPVKLFRLGFLLFWQLLLIQIAKGGTFLQNSGNLLHNRHKNFENRFRNSWDNWGQSWQPLFRNLHFAIQRGRKIISMIKVATLISIISAISKSIFKILVPIM